MKGKGRSLAVFREVTEEMLSLIITAFCPTDCVLGCAAKPSREGPWPRVSEPQGAAQGPHVTRMSAVTGLGAALRISHASLSPLSEGGLVHPEGKVKSDCLARVAESLHLLVLRVFALREPFTPSIFRRRYLDSNSTRYFNSHGWVLNTEKFEILIERQLYESKMFYLKEV